MSITTPQFTPNGLLIATPDAVRTEIEDMFKAAFGQNINLAVDTPQGQLISSLAAMVIDRDANISSIVANFDPRTAFGVYQDALGAIYFLERKPAAPTYVQLECIGKVGTVIRGKSDIAGAAKAKAESGDIYVCTTGGTIPASGNITLQFENENTGAIPAPANTVNQIYEVLSGWDSCNNPISGVIGQDVESRAEFEARRQQSVAINARGTVEAIRARVKSVPGVLDANILENRTDVPVNIDGLTLIGHSIYPIVAGGADTDIAQAIYDTVSAGCGFNGVTTVIIANEDIKFSRAVQREIKIKIEIPRGAIVPTDKIKDVIYNNFYGTSTISTSGRVGINQTIYASRFYCELANIGVQVNTISISFANDTTWYSSIALLANEIAVLDRSRIIITLV